MPILNYPKEFSPQKGISPASLFIKGPKDWADEVAKTLTQKYKRLTVIIGNNSFCGEYDIKHVQEAEVFAINFREIDNDNMILLPIARLSHFSPITLIYIDGRNKTKPIIENVVECSGFKTEEKVESIIKELDKNFSYLNEVVQSAEDFFATHLTNGKRGVKSKRGRKPKLKQENENEGK